MKNKNNLCRLIVAISLLMVGLQASLAFAQDENLWSEPINLSNTLTNSRWSDLAVDPAGGIHVVWQEELAEGEKAVLYTSLLNGNWTAPIDIVPNVAQAGMNTPRLLSDTQGILHLVYLKDGGIAYTRSFAPQAGSARGWHEPIILVPYQNHLFDFDLAMASSPDEDLFCLAYVIQIGTNSGIYVTCSRDGGLNWEPAYTVYKNLDSEKLVTRPRLAIGTDGSLHVVWVFTDFPETFPPRGLHYARSTDGGLTWRTMNVADGPYDEPAISLCAEPEIHVVWSGTADDRYRFHRWSADKGNTWEDTWRLEAGGGILGDPDLVCDSNGTLHWLTHMDDLRLAYDPERPNDVLYHTSLIGGTWAVGDVIHRGGLVGQTIKYVSAGIALGNQLHLVFDKPVTVDENNFQFEIYYISRTLDSQALQPAELQNPLEIQTSIPEIITSVTATPPSAQLGSPTASPDTTPWTAVSLGGGAALLAVLLVVAVHVTRSRR